MKLPTLLLAGSLVANVALVSLFALKPVLAPPAIRGFFTPQAGSAGTRSDSSDSSTGSKGASAKSLTAKAAAEAQVWETLHPGDLKGLIARLRAAGFPASVVRSVIQTLVSAQFAPRMREVYGLDDNAPYWKQGSGYPSSTDTKRTELNRQLNSERSKLLRELLSDDFFNTNGEVTAAQERQYGGLPRAKIDLLERINQDYAEMAGLIRAAMGGVTLPEDREKLALLEREKQADLAAILTPEELAEYNMRSSQVTSMLRGRMASFDPSESEFRAIYKVQQSISDQFATAGGMRGIDPELRRNLGEQYLQQMKAALGPARFAEYDRGMDRDYQQLAALGQRENLPTQTTLDAYGLRDYVAAESNRIYDNPAMTPADKVAALAALAQQTRTQLLAALGPTVGPIYVQQADRWLSTVERGAAVSFTGPPNGTTSYPAEGVTVFSGASGPVYKRVPAPRPPTAVAPPASTSGTAINSGTAIIR